MNVSHANQQPIDAVITWVDGEDPVHKQKLLDYLSGIGSEIPPSANPTRFFSAGELDYCVASILKFAPWIRTIYIVTDQQTPAFVAGLSETALASKIRVVDHKDIFIGYESCLPTFNSSSILPVLHRIPGLSENFLFFNDDFFLIRPVSLEDFFREGKVVLRGAWHSMSDKLWYKRLSDLLKRLNPKRVPKKMQRAGYLRRQEMSARYLGFDEAYFQIPHNPHAWTISSFSDFFAKNPDIFKKQIAHRLRSAEQFLTESLAAHIEIHRKSAILDNKLKTMQIKPASQFDWEMKLLFKIVERNQNYAFLCVQSLERGSREKQEFIRGWLDNCIGEPNTVFASCLRTGTD